MYIDPTNPVENTWLYHVNKLYELVEAGGGGGGGTAEEALRRANEALAKANQAIEAAGTAQTAAETAQTTAEGAQTAAETAQATAEAAVPEHTSSESGKLLVVDADGSLKWSNNPAWQ